MPTLSLHPRGVLSGRGLAPRVELGAICVPRPCSVVAWIAWSGNLAHWPGRPARESDLADGTPPAPATSMVALIGFLHKRLPTVQ